MQDLRLFVEHLADTMAAEFANHREAVLFRVLLDDFADVAQAAAGFDDLDRLVHAFLGHLGQALGPDRYVADVEHPAGITVETVLDDGDVDVQGVAIFERLVVWNAMADHMVDRRADRLWIALVIERGRDGFLLIDDVVVADLVQLIGGNARLDVFGNHFQHIGGQFAGDTHFGDILGGFEGDGHTGSLCARRRFLNGRGNARSNFAALKNTILPDDQRKSAAVCIASLYRMVHSWRIPRGGTKRSPGFQNPGSVLPCLVI
ncbi:hypothetical protein D3C71_1437250 [compost metagenome]